MLRKLMPLIAVNAILIFLFVWFNYAMWDIFNNGHYLTLNRMNAFQVQNTIMAEVNKGAYLGIGATTVSPNFPFWLFFISTAVNLYFIVKMAKQKPAALNEKPEALTPQVDETSTRSRVIVAEATARLSVYDAEKT